MHCAQKSEQMEQKRRMMYGCMRMQKKVADRVKFDLCRVSPAVVRRVREGRIELR